MPMKVNQKQLVAVIALPGEKRFEYFVKVVVDWEEVWGLYAEGWALAATNDGRTVFPLWPTKEYAQVCAVQEWQGFEPRSISLNDFIEELMPKLRLDGVLPGVFYTPSSKGVTPSMDELKLALDAELQKY